MVNETISNALDIIHNSTDQKAVRHARIVLNVALEDETKESLICRIQNSSDEVEIKAAKWQLWLITLDRSFEGLLEVIHNSSDERKVREAAWFLGETGNKEALEPLVELILSDKSYWIKDGAALGLFALKDQRALEPLVRAIKTDCYDTMVYALVQLDCKNIIPFLVELYISNPKGFRIRSHIYVYFQDIDVRSLPPEEIYKCQQLLKTAISNTSEERVLEGLEALLELIG